MIDDALFVDRISVIRGRSMILSDVSLSVAPRSSVAVVGRSGSGKSTLLSSILGLVRPQFGEIYVNGVSVAPMRRRALVRMRRHGIGMVFQSGELMPEIQPVENVALAALIAGMPTQEAWDRSAALLEELEVPVADRPTAELSGGERQRVAVARALINRPGLVLADEPTGALDSDLRDSLCDVLYSIPERWGAALLVVTHDRSVAERADRMVRMSDGRVVEGLAHA